MSPAAAGLFMSTAIVTAPPSRHRVQCRAAGASVPWGCDVESLDAALELQTWLTNSGLPYQKVEFKNVGAGGRGLVAKQMLYEKDRLLFLPTSLMITSESEWTRPKVGKLLKNRGLTDWPILACYLISEASVGDKSPWYSYIAALPQFPSSILQWTVSDVVTHLSTTSILDQALKQIREVEETFTDLNAAVFTKHPEEFPASIFNLTTFKWAFGILYSRLVRLPSLGQKLALVPFGDMLNHSTEVSTFLDFDSSTNTIACTLDTSYGIDDEVFISYGKRSNGELLVSYGFVPSKNPEDNVVLSVELNLKDEMYEEKVAVLKEHGLTSRQVFPVKLTGWPSQLDSFARLVTSPPTEADRYSDLAYGATAKGAKDKNKKSGSTEEQIQAYELILKSCEKSIAGCTSYLQKKKEEEEDDDMASGRRRVITSLSTLASRLCQSELTILYRTQYILRTDLRDLRTGIPRKPRNFIEKLLNLQK